MSMPQSLEGLHAGEEQLRKKSLILVRNDQKLALHFIVVEQAMNLADLLRRYEAMDEDTKVIKVLGMRLFNAFGAATQLRLSGYYQNSAMVLRDVLETVLLLDFFRTDRAAITRWRFAETKADQKEFAPVNIRMALDTRDGFTDQKRAETYKLFSELAGHPTMKSSWMMRPEKNGDAVIGPFVEKTSLEAVASEAGKLAVQAGQVIAAFIPEGWIEAELPINDFFRDQRSWMQEFYGAS